MFLATDLTITVFRHGEDVRSTVWVPEPDQSHMVTRMRLRPGPGQAVGNKVFAGKEVGTQAMVMEPWDIEFLRSKINREPNDSSEKEQ